MTLRWPRLNRGDRRLLHLGCHWCRLNRLNSMELGLPCYFSFYCSLAATGNGYTVLRATSIHSSDDEHSVCEPVQPTYLRWPQLRVTRRVALLDQLDVSDVRLQWLHDQLTTYPFGSTCSSRELDPWVLPPLSSLSAGEGIHAVVAVSHAG